MEKAANVTKFDAGGSGDNYISDGYIKSVEKIWMDSYTIAFTNTNTTIDIAKIPANKKITSIDIIIETTAAQSSGSISVGHDGDIAAFMAQTDITHNKTITSISIPGVGLINNLNSANGVPKLTGFQLVTEGTTGTIQVKLNNWTMTTGTVKSIVRYT